MKSSTIVVPLLSPHTKGAHFQNSEIIKAIDLARRDSRNHTLVPILLDAAYNSDVVPLGLQNFQSFSAAAEGGLRAIADRLLKTLRGRTAWDSYEQLFSISGFNVAYIPLLNRLGDRFAELKLKDLTPKTGARN